MSRGIRCPESFESRGEQALGTRNRVRGRTFWRVFPEVTKHGILPRPEIHWVYCVLSTLPLFCMFSSLLCFVNFSRFPFEYLVDSGDDKSGYPVPSRNPQGIPCVVDSSPFPYLRRSLLPRQRFQISVCEYLADSVDDKSGYLILSRNPQDVSCIVGYPLCSPISLQLLYNYPREST